MQIHRACISIYGSGDVHMNESNASHSTTGTEHCAPYPHPYRHTGRFGRWWFRCETAAEPHGRAPQAGGCGLRYPDVAEGSERAGAKEGRGSHRQRRWARGPPLAGGEQEARTGWAAQTGYCRLVTPQARAQIEVRRARRGCAWEDRMGLSSPSGRRWVELHQPLHRWRRLQLPPLRSA